MDREIVLTADDPTVFAKCPVCCRTGRGVIVGQYFSKAYTRRQFARGPVCVNCGSKMNKIYEVR